MIGNPIQDGDLRKYRTDLENARHALEVGHRASEDELDAIGAEREIEWEEQAQEEQTAEVRSRVARNQFEQIRQIDGAGSRSRASASIRSRGLQPVPIARLRAARTRTSLARIPRTGPKPAPPMFPTRPPTPGFRALPFRPSSSCSKTRR
jgi:hypothetical protein